MTLLDYAAYLAVGLKATVAVTVVSLLLGLSISFGVGIIRFMQIPIFSPICGLYVSIFRGTSLLIQLFWIYFSLPLLGLTLTPFTAGCIGLALNNGAYGSEIVRGALASVTKGQFEAAAALNFSSFGTLRRIVLPQAIPEMIPSFGNLSIMLLKDTALVSMINIADLTFKAQHLRTVTYDSAGVYFTALVLYFGLSLIIVAMARTLEHYARPESRSVPMFRLIFGGRA